jgi:hypothetical protein
VHVPAAAPPPFRAAQREDVGCRALARSSATSSRQIVPRAKVGIGVREPHVANNATLFRVARNRGGSHRAETDESALGVLADLPEVHPDARFVADHLGVVSGRDGGGLAGAYLRLAAVVHVDLHSPRQAVAEVRHLA